jgi:hypothetical protein
MEALSDIRPPKWYWIASWLALVWMIIGLAALVMDLMTDEAALAQMDPVQREIYLERPAWLFTVYAIAIVSGLAAPSRWCCASHGPCPHSPCRSWPW